MLGELETLLETGPEMIELRSPAYRPATEKALVIRAFSMARIGRLTRLVPNPLLMLAFLFARASPVHHDAPIEHLRSVPFR
jgi:hypothetical protein